MPDWYDVRRARLERRLALLYKDAYVSVSKRMSDYYNGWDEIEDGISIHHQGMYERIDAEYDKYKAGLYDPEYLIQRAQENGVDLQKMWYWKKYQEGTLTAEDFFERYVIAQEARGEYWENVRNDIANELTRTNIKASQYMNEATPEVWRHANNDLGMQAQKSAMEQGVTGYRFDMIDKFALAVVLREFGRVVPAVKVVDEDKDIDWNKTKLQNAVYNAVRRGYDFNGLADEIQKVTGMNRNSAMRNARTALTNAKEAGKQDRRNELNKMGCKTTKRWIDVHDSIPPERKEHWEAHDQEVPSDEPFIVGGEQLWYPGDPLGSSWNVQNCRCKSKDVGFKFYSNLTDEQRERANIKVY